MAADCATVRTPARRGRRRLARSLALKARAERRIPSGTQTFSKGPTQFVQGVAPVFLARGQGSHVWDVDGHEYIDYVMALGPVLLGYVHPAVTRAVQRQLRQGTVFSLPHPLEVEVAELLCDTIPCAEMVRFGKNGSDATAAAVRVSRAYTGRDLIACCGYHGWHDWSIGATTRRAGVPEAVRGLTVPFQYNDLESLRRIFAEHPRQVAAVILEPVGVEPPQGEFLQQVRELARREGAVLIFDEVITGFRLALGGAQDYFGVTPDLACFGKGMANGFPLSAVVGRREIMRLFEEVFFSSTFGGETLSLAAAAATIAELRKGRALPHLWAQGRRLQDGYNALAADCGIGRQTACVGLAPRTALTFCTPTGEESLTLKSLFQQEVIRRGVLSAGYQFISAAHTDADVDATLRAWRAALGVVARAIGDDNAESLLEGSPVAPVFRRA